MTDSTGPVKPRLSDENPSARVDLDQPSWQLSQALVRGDLKPLAFLTGRDSTGRDSTGRDHTGRDSGDVRPARPKPRGDSARRTALALGMTAVGVFLGGAYLLLQRDEAAPSALSGLAAVALAMQALWYRLRR